MQIKLLKPHRHAGRDYPPGATLDLPNGKAEWLVSLGVASKASGISAEPMADDGASTNEPQEG